MVRCADVRSRESHASQAEFKMILQKSARSNFGFLNVSTSSFTVPNVLSGRCAIP